ncbi:hypothetical protein ACRALDRAFT_211215 [Sodiomyces alcalophilus JCM 7366]|uniref:uncharacterized protein n=1 Tax=Sodiomyces alcalophilus JCM 7366 TaxID=591952 RepID=UPI0039B392D0
MSDSAGWKLQKISFSQTLLRWVSGRVAFLGQKGPSDTYPFLCRSLQKRAVNPLFISKATEEPVGTILPIGHMKPSPCAQQSIPTVSVEPCICSPGLSVQGTMVQYRRSSRVLRFAHWDPVRMPVALQVGRATCTGVDCYQSNALENAGRKRAHGEHRIWEAQLDFFSTDSTNDMGLSYFFFVSYMLLLNTAGNAMALAAARFHVEYWYPGLFACNAIQSTSWKFPCTDRSSLGGGGYATNPCAYGGRLALQQRDPRGGNRGRGDRNLGWVTSQSEVSSTARPELARPQNRRPPRQCAHVLVSNEYYSVTFAHRHRHDDATRCFVDSFWARMWLDRDEFLARVDDHSRRQHPLAFRPREIYQATLNGDHWGPYVVWSSGLDLPSAVGMSPDDDGRKERSPRGCPSKRGRVNWGRGELGPIPGIKGDPLLSFWRASLHWRTSLLIGSPGWGARSVPPRIDHTERHVKTNHLYLEVAAYRKEETATDYQTIPALPICVDFTCSNPSVRAQVWQGEARGMDSDASPLSLPCVLSILRGEERRVLSSLSSSHGVIEQYVLLLSLSPYRIPEDVVYTYTEVFGVQLWPPPPYSFRIASWRRVSASGPKLRHAKAPKPVAAPE